MLSLKPDIRVLALLACLVALGCATTPQHAHFNEAPLGANTLGVDASSTEYEPLPVFPTSSLVAPEELATEHHTMAPEVRNNGLTNIYVVQSQFGDFPALGIEMARARITEVHALAQLAEMKKTEAFAKGAGKELKDFALGPFRWAKKVVRNPLYIVMAIPGDIFKIYGLADGTRKLVQMGFSKEAINDFIGFSSAKHNLARSLDVDNGSSNAVLQHELHQVAKAYYAGGAPLHIAQRYVPGLPMPTFTIGDGMGSIGKGVDIITDELGGKNTRNQLMRMKVPRRMRKQLMKNRWYSPRARKHMIRALHNVKDAKDRKDYVRMALQADSEDHAYYFRRTAKMLAALYKHDGPITRLHVDEESGIAMAETEAGDVVIPLFADYIVWSPEVAEMFETLPGKLPSGLQKADRRLYVSGNLSPRAKAELEERGYTVHAEALALLEKPTETKKKPGFLGRWRRTKGPDAVANKSE